MTIGVVIPAFNAERYLTDAIESVLRQTAPPDRIVVVDDGSTDGTPAVAERFGPAVMCIRQSNRGVAAARNRGAKIADTEWIAFLDADDEWLPEKLARQRAALAGSVGVCFTAIRVRHESSGETYDTGIDGAKTDLESLLFHRDGIPLATPSTGLVHRALFDRVGGFDESLANCADWDFLIRLRIITEFVYVDEPLVLYRRHGSNMSRSVALLDCESVALLQKAFRSSELSPSLRKRARQCFAWNDIVLAGSYSHAGRWGRAVHLAIRAIARDPLLLARIAGLPARHIRRRRARSVTE